MTNNVILLAAHRVVKMPLPARKPRFKDNTRHIDLGRSHATVVITDYTSNGLGFTARFTEKGHLVPIVETGRTAAEALRKLRINPLVKKYRHMKWRY